jgi:hypothetical protein
MTGVAIPRGANGRRPEASLRRKPTINDVGPNRRRLGWDGLTSSQQGTGCQCRNPSARFAGHSGRRVPPQQGSDRAGHQSADLRRDTDGSPRFGPVGTPMALENVARKKG